MLFIEMNCAAADRDATILSIRLQTGQMRSQFVPIAGVPLAEMLAPTVYRELKWIADGMADRTSALSAPEYRFSSQGLVLQGLRVSVQDHVNGDRRLLLTFQTAIGSLDRLFSVRTILGAGEMKVARRDVLRDTCELARSAIDLSTYQAQALSQTLRPEELDGLHNAVEMLRLRLSMLIRDIEHDGAGMVGADVQPMPPSVAAS